MRVNVKKKKMMISSEHDEKVAEESKSACAFCRKNVGCHSILCQFYRCLVHNRCSGIGDKLKENRNFKYQVSANLQTIIAEGC